MLTTCIIVVLAAGALADLQALDATSNITVPAEQYFIDKIFDKYGDKGIITFEVCKQFEFLFLHLPYLLNFVFVIYLVDNKQLHVLVEWL